MPTKQHGRHPTWSMSEAKGARLGPTASHAGSLNGTGIVHSGHAAPTGHMSTAMVPGKPNISPKISSAIQPQTCVLMISTIIPLGLVYNIFFGM